MSEAPAQYDGKTVAAVDCCGTCTQLALALARLINAVTLPYSDPRHEDKARMMETTLLEANHVLWEHRHLLDRSHISRMVYVK